MKKIIVLMFMTLMVLVSTSVMAGILVTADWLKANKDATNVVVVDVQNKSATYDKGHIEGALKVTRHVDLEDYTRYPPNKYPPQKQFVDLMSRLGITNNSTVVAYDDHHGIFASRLLFIMELYGHNTDKLKILDGGVVQWQTAGNQLTTKAKQAAPTTYTAAEPNMNLLVNWSDVLRDVVQKQNTNVVLHDARPGKEYRGEKIRAIRAGHIPGAINVTGADAANLKKEQTYKSPDQIKKVFESAGITRDKTIYTYCHSSDRSAHVYMTLKHILGYPNVKIYEGAWKEWSVLTALPAENLHWGTE